MSRSDAIRLIETLREDRAVWAIAPCEHEYRLSDSELFYGAEIPPAGKECVRTLREDLRVTQREVERLRSRLTSGFTKRSVEVKLGKTVEKIVTALPGFPIDRSDCRAIFDPIDYVGFVGLSAGNVSRLEFLDIKTGGARLSPVQKAIRDAVEDRKVNLREVDA
jgi:predicted Holliday junction resolvase-like endonuclease